MRQLFSIFEASWWSQVNVVAFFVLFAAIIFIAYRPSARAKHEQNAQLPLRDDE